MSETNYTIGGMSDLAIDIEACYFKGMTEQDTADHLGVSYQMVCDYFDELDANGSSTVSDMEYDDSMDGDFDSAMTSAGFGTDEDYGCYDSGDY